MDKIRIGTNVFLPMPVVLVGSVIDGRPNFLTAGWVSRVNANPPMIAVGINRIHTTAKGIQENGAFSINLPTKEMVEETDFCGLVSGRDTDKSGIFTHFSGTLTNAPMIRDCPLTMECRVVDTVELPTNLLFIGEIVAGYANEGVMNDGNMDITTIDPILLTMPDNRYWTLGDYAGRAWSEGKNLENAH